MIILSDGDRVRLARIGQGWTLQDVADRIGCSISYLSKVENNNRPVPKELLTLMDSIKGSDWYYIILETLNVSVDEYISQKNYELCITTLNNALKIKED